MKLGNPIDTESLPFHPLANLFPLIEGEEFEQLVASVKAHRLREPIVLKDGLILDGRNRYQALVAAGLIDSAKTLADTAIFFPRYFRLFKDEKEGDPLAYVLDKNLTRRHLNDDQRRFVAARIVNMGRGRPSENPAECGIKIADAAKLVNVDAAGTERARTVLANATPEICQSVEHGRLSVAAAAKASSFAPEIQKKIVDAAEAGKANVVKLVIKQEARAARERKLGAKQLADPDGKFGVIIDDFEWDFEVRSEAGKDRHAANHYETAGDAHTAEEIVARTAGRFACAADDCVHFMYVTVPHLALAIKVMELRGFKYVSNYVMEKDRIITGYWNRNRHEHLLIGVKGKPDCPAPGTQWDSIIKAPVSDHSAKPEAVLEMIETYFPTMPKIELNRRGPARPGWTAWGNEAEPMS